MPMPAVSRRGLALLGVFAIACSATAPPLMGSPQETSVAEAENTKEEDILELLELTGSGDLGVQVMQQMLQNFRTSLPGVPEEFWTEFEASVDASQLNEMVVPIYDRHFSWEEIRAMRDFYATPAGRSIVKKLPMVMQESMEAGRVWGEQIAERVVRQLEERKLIQKPQS